jgi:hypothetical protein
MREIPHGHEGGNREQDLAKEVRALLSSSKVLNDRFETFNPQGQKEIITAFENTRTAIPNDFNRLIRAMDQVGVSESPRPPSPDRSNAANA